MESSGLERREQKEERNDSWNNHPSENKRDLGKYADVEQRVLLMEDGKSK